MFYAIFGFKAHPSFERLHGLGDGYATAEQAEAACRASDAQWGDRDFIRVVEAPNYYEASKLLTGQGKHAIKEVL